MDPITYTLLVSAAVLAVAVPIAVAKRLKNESAHAKQARKRAADRKQKKAFADTEPMCDSNPLGGYEYNLRLGKESGTQVLPLSREQEDTIRLIFEGFHPPLKKEQRFRAGPDVNTAAGVPVSMSAFDELNVVESGYHVEYLAPEYVWPESNK